MYSFVAVRLVYSLWGSKKGFSQKNTPAKVSPLYKYITRYDVYTTYTAERTTTCFYMFFLNIIFTSVTLFRTRSDETLFRPLRLCDHCSYIMHSL